MSEHLLAPIVEAGDMIGHGRTTVYRLINEGKLEAVKSGKRRLVVVESIRNYVQSLRSQNGGV
jgi:excisionase family DNA binding protein